MRTKPISHRPPPPDPLQRMVKHLHCYGPRAADIRERADAACYALDLAGRDLERRHDR